MLRNIQNMFIFGHFKNVHLMQKIFYIYSRHIVFADLTSENFFKIARSFIFISMYRRLLNVPWTSLGHLCCVENFQRHKSLCCILFRYIMVYNLYRINMAYYYRQERDCKNSSILGNFVRMRKMT